MLPALLRACPHQWQRPLPKLTCSSFLEFHSTLHFGFLSLPLSLIVMVTRGLAVSIFKFSWTIKVSDFNRSCCTGPKPCVVMCPTSTHVVSLALNYSFFCFNSNDFKGIKWENGCLPLSTYLLFLMIFIPSCISEFTAAFTYWHSKESSLACLVGLLQYIFLAFFFIQKYILPSFFF